MNSKLAILDPYYSDLATLTGTGWAMPLSYLQDMQPTRSIQPSGSTSGNTIVIDFGSAVTCDSLALGRVRAPPDAMMTIEAATSEGGLASPAYSSGSVSIWPTTGKPTDRGVVYYDVFKEIAAGSAYRWWKITIDAEEVGRLYHGPIWQPTYNYSYGWERGRAPLDIRVDTPGGHTLTDKKNSPRIWTLPLNFISRADADDFFDDLEGRIGTAGDFFVCLDPTETTRLHRKMMMATLAEVPSRAQQHLNVFRATLKLRELR